MIDFSKIWIPRLSNEEIRGRADDVKEHLATKVSRAFYVSYDVIMKRLDAEGISPIQE